MVTPPADARVRLRITTVSGRVTVSAESGGEVGVGASGSVSETPTATSRSDHGSPPTPSR